MEARFANGSWAGSAQGWTEGDAWAYTFDVMHDVSGESSHHVTREEKSASHCRLIILSGLIQLKGGREPFLAFLDDHFDNGHNDHTNEPSHHIPYLYSLAGSPSRAAERIHAIAFETGDYGLGPEGLRGNEDLGQMSSWLLFSALGFYPVNPASDEYVVASPLFSTIDIDLPHPHDRMKADIPLRIRAPDAPHKKYVAGVTVNGRALDRPILKHADLISGGEILFAMSAERTDWGSGEGT